MTSNHHTPLPLDGTTTPEMTGELFNTPYGQLDSAITNLLAGDLAFTQFKLADATELTLDNNVAGAVTITQSYHSIDTNADAASGELATINGGAAGDTLKIFANNDARSIVIKNGTGNILTFDSADITLDEDHKIVEFLFDGTNWRQVGGGGGGGGGGGIGSPVIKTISVGGVITAGADRNIVAAANSGTADDLIEITGLSVGETVWLVADTGDTITVKHNDAGATVKILLADGNDRLLSEDNPVILRLRSTNELVQEISPTPRTRVFHSLDQSILTSTPTILAFDSERWDNAGLHDIVTNNSRLTVPDGEAGLWDIEVAIAFASNSTGNRIVEIIHNGATVIASARNPATGGGLFSSYTISTQYELAVSDYVEVQVFQDSGVSINIVAFGNLSAEFMMKRSTA
jgi:hypothetical protein